MKNITRNVLLFLIVAILSLAACAPANTPREITILHTNDIHGHFTPDPASWLEGNPPVGGFAAMDYYIQAERADAGNSLLLDAGDIMTGNLICKKKYEGAYGGALIEMMNMIGYDCMTIGNHEFDDQGNDLSAIENIHKLEQLANFPFLCANMIDSSGNDFGTPHYEIYEINGLRIGVIGITYHQMLGMASAENLEGFYTTDPAEKVNEIVGYIDDKTDLLIVLSHLGYENDIELAKHIDNVDVIVGGHSHTRLTEPDKVNGVLIVQAGSYNHNLGRLDLTVAGDTVQSYSGRLITPMVEGTQAQPELQALIDSFAVLIETEYGAIIGQLDQDWRNAYSEECNVGDWLTDAMRKQTGADIAFLNSGGIRANIPAGPISKKDIFELLPFQNYLETFEVTGEELKSIVQENANAQRLETHGILQLSGLTYGWKKTGDNIKVSNIKINGKPIEDSKTYTIASVDYVISNYNRYYGVEPRDIHNTGKILADVIIDEIIKTGTIESSTEKRIIRIE